MSLALSLTPRVRFPLARSDEFPAGRLQPYLAVGPVWVVSTWTESGLGKGRAHSLGLVAGGGATFAMTASTGMFVDARLSRVAPEYQVRMPGDVSGKVSNSLVRGQVVVGFSVNAGGR